MPMLVHDIPGPHNALVTQPAVGSAAPTTHFPLFVAPWPCRVTEITLTFGAAVTGGAARFDFSLVNRGAGGGTAEWTVLALAAGTNVAAFTARPLFSSAAGVFLNTNDLLSLGYVKQGAGFDVPATLTRVVFVGA